MERASSSTACSSSSSSDAAPTGGRPPPTLAVGELVHLFIPGIVPLPATVEFVAEEVCLKVVVPLKGPRIKVGAEAEMRANGGQWLGTISWFQNDRLDDEEPGFYHFVWIPMDTSPVVNQVWPESAKNVLVMVNEVNQPKPEVKVSLNVIPTNESSQAMVEANLHVIPTNELSQAMVDLDVTAPARIGVDGFGDIERFLIDKALQSLNVEVVAIYSPVPLKTMVEVWKSPNVSISVKDDKTVIFQKRYYEWSKKDKSEEKKRKDEEMEEEKKRKDVKAKENEKRIFIKTKQTEVTVFTERDKVCWKDANADFVVECSTCLNNDKDVQSNDLVQSQIHDKNESLNSCLGGLPKAVKASDLYVVAQSNNCTPERLAGLLPHIPNDQELVRRAASFNIVVSSKTSAKIVRHVEVLPDWNEEPTSAFLATVVHHGTIHADMSNVDLHVTLEKADNYIDTEDILIWPYDAAQTLIAVMGLCLDIVRCVPVGGCRLKLI